MSEPAREYAQGDRVRQAGGGPVMVVTEVYPVTFAYRFRCFWLGIDGAPHHDLFRAEQLEPVTSDEPA